ncbi:MAG: hypothetical protein K6C11_02885 [Bacilli bacterium]|nr:hypothetical protein [Bacilli bacterium]
MEKLKKVSRIGLVVVGLGIFLTLLFLNLDTFQRAIIRFLDVFDLKNLNTFFDNYLESRNTVYEEFSGEVSDKVNTFVEVISNFKITKESVIEFLLNLLNYFYLVLMYVLNVGVNVVFITFIFVRESIYGSNLAIKTSKAAKIYIKVRSFIIKVISKIKEFLVYLLTLIKKYKRKIALAILLVLIANGFLLRFIVELLIFIEAYVYHSINLDAYLVFESMFKSLVVWAYPFVCKIPSAVWWMILYTSLFMLGLGRAKYKLRRNHDKLKKFANEDLTQTTFINGAPGTGKTLLNVSLSLASEENYIDELEKLMLDYEAKYRFLNFAEIRNRPEDFPMHKEYIDAYKKLNERGTFLISNYAIYSPYYMQYSKIFNFDFMRKNKAAKEYPLEEYIVMSLSEIDKEYNSHDNMKDVGEDGAHTFFSTVSHDLKRHCKIFCDYQLKDQVPLRIRGNAEYFINIKKRSIKMPLILKLYYLPFKGLKIIVEKIIKAYELRKTRINKKTMRTSTGKYKRNNINFCYIVLRNLNTTLTKICAWFEYYRYFRLSTLISQEGEDKGRSKKININLCDLSIENRKLYDSTFLSYAYAQKKNKDFNTIESFTSLTPSIEELNKCNSRFYNKINNN